MDPESVVASRPGAGILTLLGACRTLYTALPEGRAWRLAGEGSSENDVSFQPLREGNFPGETAALFVGEIRKKLDRCVRVK